MRRAGPLIAAALLATLAVPIVLGGRDALWQALGFSPRGYLVLLAVVSVSWFARAFKIRLLLRRLDVAARFWPVFLISLATDFAFISTPGGVGGYAAGVFYLRRAGATTSGAATVTAADQLLDWAFFALALPIAGLALIRSDVPPALAWLAFGTSAVMLGAGAAALIARRTVGAWLFNENAISRRWPRLKSWQHLAREFFRSLQEHAGVLLNGGPRFFAGMLLMSALQWLGRYGVLWVALTLLGHKVSFALTLLLQALVLHAAMWTGVPSGGGGAELGLTAALSAWVPATDLATALLLWRVATLYICLIAGAIAIGLLAHRRHAHAADQGTIEGAG
jgi:uncharacterized protein (TIRG00374 family)